MRNSGNLMNKECLNVLSKCAVKKAGKFRIPIARVTGQWRDCEAITFFTTTPANSNPLSSGFCAQTIVSGCPRWIWRKKKKPERKKHSVSFISRIWIISRKTELMRRRFSQIFFGTSSTAYYDANYSVAGQVREEIKKNEISISTLDYFCIFLFCSMIAFVKIIVTICHAKLFVTAKRCKYYTYNLHIVQFQNLWNLEEERIKLIFWNEIVTDSSFL